MTLTAPVVKATYTSVQSDGGNLGKAVTTGATVATGDALVFVMGGDTTTDTFGAPTPGTWAEITLPDNAISVTGGLIRAWINRAPAASTTYTATATSSTRRSCIGALLSGVDPWLPIDVASSLESVAGSSHAPPSVTSKLDASLVLDFPMQRQFSPDTDLWTVPSSGLTWTKQADVQGSDVNNNIRLAFGSATQATAGAVSTTAWTQSDVNEPAMVIRLVFAPITWTMVASATVQTNTSGSGSTVTLSPATTASNGDIDVFVVGSDTTVTTPTGFTLSSTFVNNQGSYVFTRKCTGGESASLTLTTTGNFSTEGRWLRMRAHTGNADIDGIINAHVDNANGTAPPTLTSGTLATNQDFSLVASVNTNASGSAPTAPVWVSGYVADAAPIIGTTTTTAAGFYGIGTRKGTAAESGTFVSWTNNMLNRYGYLVLLKPVAATNVTINDTSNGALPGGTNEAPTIGVTIQDASSGALPGGTNEAASLVKQDTSSGALPGGSTETVLIGVTKQDTSGGAAAGSSTDTLIRGVTLTDTSGGAMPGSSTDTTAIGVTLQDSSSGAMPGVSTDTPSTAVVFQDASGGILPGGTQQAPTIGVTITDTSSGATAGSSAETIQTGQIINDTSGGMSAGSSTETLVRGVTLGDSSGGLSAGVSGETVAVGKVFTDTSGGASPGGSTDTVSTGGGADVTIQDRSGGAGAAGSTDTASASPPDPAVHDLMVMPVLQKALTCLSAEENKVANPVAQYVIRPGASFIAMADQYADECCSGIGWVRPGPMWESDDFPEQRTAVSIDDPGYYAVQVELGLMRCVPTVSDVPGGLDSKPTSAQWLAATQAAMDDAAALRRAICCLRDQYGAGFVITGPITPLENEGNCSGITVVLTMRVPACDCTE